MRQETARGKSVARLELCSLLRQEAHSPVTVSTKSKEFHSGNSPHESKRATCCTDVGNNPGPPATVAATLHVDTLKGGKSGTVEVFSLSENTAWSDVGNHLSPVVFRVLESETHLKVIYKP